MPVLNLFSLFYFLLKFSFFGPISSQYLKNSICFQACPKFIGKISSFHQVILSIICDDKTVFSCREAVISPFTTQNFIAFCLNWDIVAKKQLDWPSYCFIWSIYICSSLSKPMLALCLKLAILKDQFYLHFFYLTIISRYSPWLYFSTNLAD
jgi:hypothetical protein